MAYANTDYGSPIWAKFESVTSDVSASQSHVRATQWSSALAALNSALSAITDLQSEIIQEQDRQALKARVEKESANAI